MLFSILEKETCWADPPTSRLPYSTDSCFHCLIFVCVSISLQISKLQISKTWEICYSPTSAVLNFEFARSLVRKFLTS